MLRNPDIQGPHNGTLLVNKMAEDVEMLLYRIVSSGTSGIYIYLFIFVYLVP